MLLRESEGEIKFYDTINTTFTVMIKSGVYENAGFEMVEDSIKLLTFYILIII